MKSTPVYAIIVTAAVFSLTAAGFAVTQDGSGTKTRTSSMTSAQSPKLIALRFYADWCPGCRAMNPELEKAMKESADAPVLFVTLDQTDRESHQAEYLLAALGYGDLWKEYAGKTGFVLVVDPQTKRVVSKLTPKENAKQMCSAIEHAMNG